MPAKMKYTKEQIIDAALNVVREKGATALSARALAKKLGTSPQPIFSYFDNMNEVQSEMLKAAKAKYAGYVKKGLEQDLAFKGVGTQYILFAIQDPKLFQLLFMSEQPQKPAVANVLPVIDDNYNEILLSVQNGYGLSEDEAEHLYRHLWIYTHGIAVLCATNMCVFTVDEISKMMTEVFRGTLNEIKGGTAQ